MENHPADVQHWSWWEDQDVARCTGTFGGLRNDFLWKDAMLKHLESKPAPGSGKSASYTGRLDGPDGIKHVETAWHAALFYRPDEFRAMMTPQKVISASEEVQGSRRLYKITVNRSDVYREDIFFDPGRNYVVTKIVGYPDLKDLSSQHIAEVSTFTEPKPGIYFPGSVKHTSIQKGKSELDLTRVFTNVRINEAIDPGKLQLRFPAGTQVGDTRSGKTYKVDENEQPIGPEEPLAKPRDLTGRGKHPATLQAGTPWAAVLLWSVAGVALAGGLAFVVVRRRRAARSEG